MTTYQLANFPNLFCLLSDFDVCGTQIGASFAKNSLEKVSSRSEVQHFLCNTAYKNRIRRNMKKKL